MTLKEFVLDQCIRRGMFARHASRVFARIEEIEPRLRPCWGMDVSTCSGEFMAILGNAVRQQAKIWIDANVPGAWYKPLFDCDDNESRVRMRDLLGVALVEKPQ